jgi:hypothetical protein
MTANDADLLDGHPAPPGTIEPWLKPINVYMSSAALTAIAVRMSRRALRGERLDSEE